MVSPTTSIAEEAAEASCWMIRIFSLTSSVASDAQAAVPGGGWKHGPMVGTRTCLILWDVDHTLIDNGGVSKESYALAFEILVGDVPRTPPVTDGRTDLAIMQDFLESNGVDSDAISVERRFEALVTASQRNRERLAERGSVLPGVVECLSRLSTVPGVIQSVLTGNIEENTRMKLEIFGLDRWLDLSVGGFGAEHRVRGMLVPVAQAKASRAYGFDPRTAVTVLVGDTHLDVQAALVGGARVIAVATGVDSVEELAHAGADVVLPGLGDPEAFCAAVDHVRELGSVGPRARVAGA